ncbi:MAG TPA: hypothetical protein VLT33_03320 [Labilithrix sp.]|nr:hypothetical protein [Labilithrix sp.]
MACFSSVRLVSFVALPLLVGACTSFRAEDQPSPTTAKPDDPAVPDGGPSVTGTPDRGIQIVVGDPKATAFVMQGGSLALPVKLTRRQSSTGDVDVTVAHLPADVTADPLTIKTGSSEGTLTLRAKATSTQGGPVALEIGAVEKGPTGAGTTTKLSAFVRGGRGALDTTFGDKGSVLHVYGGGSQSTFLDAKTLRDGSILVSAKVRSNSVLSRFTSAGVLDPTFAAATGGTTVLISSQGNTRVGAYEPASPAKGFIYALESGGFKPTLFHLNLDGTPDLGFNGTGKVTIDDGLANGHGVELVVLPDGKALVLLTHASGSGFAAVSRWNSDGTIDPTYGNAGTCQLPSQAARMIPRPGGGVLVLTAAVLATVHGCTSAGMLDVMVGGAPDYSLSAPNAVDFTNTADGGMAVLAIEAGQTTHAMWSRFNTSLVKNTSIGILGDVPVRFPEASTINAQDDDGMLVAASINSEFKVVRYLPTGKEDPDFGTAGVATFNVGDTNGSHLVKLVPQPDGRFVAIGSNDNGFDAAILRFWP